MKVRLNVKVEKDTATAEWNSEVVDYSYIGHFIRTFQDIEWSLCSVPYAVSNV